MSNFSSNNQKKWGDYYIGVDVGTGSCGWAAVDSNYNILKIAGKSLWGTRLFDTANTAAERRNYRTSRRRLMRSKQRIFLLEELFEEEISKVDPDFFLRLHESELKREDRTNSTSRFNIFNDKTFTDRDYLKEYPTPYHLRFALMKECPKDVRLLFLAIHHIIKHRGHFLFQNFNVSNSKENLPSIWSECIDNFIDELCSHRNDLLDNLDETDSDYQGIKNSFFDKFDLLFNILTDKNSTISEKEKSLYSSFRDPIDDFLKFVGAPPSNKKSTFSKKIESMCKLLAGGTVKAEDLFILPEDSEAASEKISLNDAEFDSLLAVFEDGQKGILEKIKSFFDLIKLQGILSDSSSISECKIGVYNQHKKDKSTLKKLFKNVISTEILHQVEFKGNQLDFFHAIFKDTKPKSYDSVYGILTHKEKVVNCFINNKKTTKENQRYLDKLKQYKEYFEKIYSIFSNGTTNVKINSEELDLLKRLSEIKGIFPLLVNTDNGVLPYQLNLYELNIILDRASKVFPFLNSKDKDDISVADKIRSILTFRIPYFVGPLNRHSKYSWIVRDEQVKITPWNFNKVVNLQESRANFIKRMTSKCTYLKAEDVLPKNSLIYSKFVALNILNSIKVNGSRLNDIAPDTVKDLYINHVLQHCTVTLNSIRKYLISKGLFDEKTDVLSGMDSDQNISSDSFFKLQKTIISKSISYEDLKKLPETTLEQIIFYCTLFSGDRDSIKSSISSLEGINVLKQKDSSVIERLSKLSFSGWGRLSAKFLTQISGVEKSDPLSETDSIIGFMLKGKGNLMELLGSSFTFSDEIERINNAYKHEIKFSYEDLVEPLYVSPSVKRMIWQTLQVVHELTEKIIGYSPKKIFIEMSRGTLENQKGQRTVSRKKKIEELYKNCKSLALELGFTKDYLTKTKAELNATDATRFLSDRVYLYYTQMGKCMYSGEPIDFAQLTNENIYDIDHIIPQNFTKDDSLDNRVLVKRTINANKSNSYPISPNIQNTQAPFWTYLEKNGLISKSKYNRLMRKSPLSSAEKEGFIQRQLVETQQSTKAIATLLSELYTDSKIIYPKAGLVSEFKQQFDLVKVRELNELHHAKDAYCNVVVGNVYYEKFTNEISRFLRESNEHYTFSASNKAYIFKNPNEIRLKRLGVWNSENNKSIRVVEKNYKRNNILLTRKQEIITGGFFEQNISVAKQDLVPKKKNLEPIKYGGYSGVSGAFFSFISYIEEKKTKKDSSNKRVFAFKSIPLYCLNRENSIEKSINTYLEESENLKDVDVIIPQIKIPFILKKVDENFLLLCSGKTGDQLITKQFNSLVLNNHLQKILKAVLKFNSRRSLFVEVGQNKDFILDESRLGFSNSDLNELLLCLKDKVNNSVFKALPETIKTLLMDLDFSKSEKFDLKELSNDEQKVKNHELRVLFAKCKVISEFLKAFQNNGVASDLRLIGGTQFAGKVNISAKIDLEKVNYSLLYQSVTGFYSKEVNLREICKWHGA